ncbi:MAG TPA: hypothetical protein VFZ61_07400 [Polyangiales bacterium]
MLKGLPLLVFLLAATGSWSPALAESVLLWETPTIRPGLCAALRIQLTGVATVTCQPGAQAGPLSERIRAASARVASVPAKVGVLLERDPDPSLVRMYLVASGSDQAVISIERIEDRPDADVDRSLALKVRDALDVMIAAEAAQREAPALPALLVPKPRPSALAQRWQTAIEAGAAASWGAHTRFSGILAVGARLLRGRTYGELVGALRMSTAIRTENRFGVVDAEEWGATLALRIGRRVARFGLGALAIVGLDRVGARGVTSDGSAGEETVAVLHTDIGLDLRVQLVQGVWMRLAPALQIYPIAQRFTLDDQLVTELGRLRVDVPLTLLVTLPAVAEEQ